MLSNLCVCVLFMQQKDCFWVQANVVYWIMASRMSFIERWISSGLRVCEYFWILWIISGGLAALRPNLTQSGSAEGRWKHSHYANVRCVGSSAVKTNTNTH